MKATCAHCGLWRHRRARRLCQQCYYRHRDLYPRTKIARPYTAREREIIRRDWKHRSLAAIAADLGREPHDVHEAAVRFGAHTPSRRVKPVTAATRRRILELHGHGLSNREIGLATKRSHVLVGRVLAGQGLRSNCRASNRDRFPERWRQKIGDRHRERIRRDGVAEVLPCLRHLIPDRAQAVRMGWPQANTLLEARILEFLAEHGPSTVVTIFAALARNTHWSRLTTRGLRNRGLLANRGRAGRYVLYGLADGVERTWCAYRDPRMNREAESA